MSYFNLVFPLFSLLLALPAANTSPQTARALPDSTEVVVRSPPADILDAFRDNPDYHYIQDKTRAMTWWEELKQWFFNWLSDLLEASEQGTAWQYFFYGLALLILAFAILQFFKMDVRGLFSSQKKRPQMFYPSSVEQIQARDFLLMADEALQLGNLRIAARMYYMHVLQMLDAQEIIEWQPRKTNQDYLYECRQSIFKPQFARLTYLFDYSWYGDFPVDQHLVEEMRALALDVESIKGARE